MVRDSQGNSARNAIAIYIFAAVLLCALFGNCSSAVPKDRLPEPVIEDHPELVDLYWKAWSLVHQTRKRGNNTNQFPRNYLNIDNGDVISQWSTLSAALFTVYGYHVYPVMESLDLFYDKQRSDGFISRVYITNSGSPLHLPTRQDPMINPPLFSWVELKYFYLSADTTRLRKVFPALEKYFLWLDSNCRTKNNIGDLYYSTPIGSGMINLPRGDIEFGGWTDLSAQMAMFARHLAEIAQLLSFNSKAVYYQRKCLNISNAVQSNLWHPDSAFYYDINREGKPVKLQTIAGFWPLIAKIPDEQSAAGLIQHLKDSSDFRLPHMFPSVSVKELEYNPKGFYWRGGVWGITNYMIIRGLMEYGEYSFANRAAWNHITNMSKVYSDFASDTLIDPNGNISLPGKTIWKLYAPEEQEPGTRWDAYYQCEPDFIAFSGHGPISMLIENILGFQVNAPADQLTWTITRMDRHGIKHLTFGDNVVSIWADRRIESQSLFTVHGETNSDVSVNFVLEPDTISLKFEPGPIEVTFLPDNFILRDRFLP
ncbi:MAG TPA: hypothetical protein DHW42_09880 [Candidatus Marinimicrobia bacterium]|nr:hypothetical protein [Candidatus Neomarinimicrobiota bacterium]